jgi:hypothetical protein
MSQETEDAIAIQQALVSRERAKQLAKLEALKRDIRSQIAKGGGYNPEGDHPSTDYREYPKIINRPNQPAVVVHNRGEETQLLGHAHPPAKPVAVEINEIAAVEQVRVKRKYTKRQTPAPLPQNLD